MIARPPQMLQMSAAETTQMSALASEDTSGVETGPMSAAATVQMSAVGTREMSAAETGQMSHRALDNLCWASYVEAE